MEDSELTWRKASRSGTGNGGNDACVEIATLPETVMVRDSTNPHGPILAVPSADWQRFVAELRP